MPTTFCKNFNTEKVMAAGRGEYDRHQGVIGGTRKLVEAGVATVEEGDRLIAVSGEKFVKVIGAIFPNMRLQTSLLHSARIVGRELTGAIMNVSDVAGKALKRIPMTAHKTLLYGKVVKAIEDMKPLHASAVKDGYQGSLKDFKELVVRTMRRGDVHENLHVTSAARVARAALTEQMEKGVKAGIFGEITEEGLEKKIKETASTYVSRVMDQAALDIHHDRVIEVLMEHGHSEAEAGQIFLSWKHVAKSRSSATAADISSAKAAATKERTVTIADSILDDLYGDGSNKSILSQNLDDILYRYITSIGMDAEVVTRFGGLDAPTVVQAMDAEAARLLKGVDAKQVKKITKEVEARKRDMHHILNELRGLHDAPDSVAGRFGHKIRQTVGLSRLGLVTFSSIPDLAMPILQHGLLPTLRDGWLPMLADLGSIRAGRGSVLHENTRAAGQAIDRLLGIVSRGELGFTGMGTDLFDKTMDAFNFANGLRFWNDLNKEVAGHIIQKRVQRVARQVANGSALSRNDRLWITRLRMSDDELGRIAGQLSQNGERVADWADADVGVKYLGSLSQEINRTIITLDAGDRPIAAVTSEWVAFMTQFKSFGMAVTTKVVIPMGQTLANRDAVGAFYAGQYIVYATMLGMLSDKLKRVINNDDREFNDQELLVRAVDRSGVFGVLPELLATTNGISRHRFSEALGIPKRSISPAHEFGNLALGASYSWGSDGYRAVGASLSGQGFSEGDTNAVLRTLPFQNLWLIRLGLTAQQELE